MISPVLLVLLSILLLIALIMWVKLDTFLSFLVVSILLALSCGLNGPEIGKSISTGIGSTLGSLVTILGFGAMLGKLVADSGAAQRITTSMIGLFGTRRIQWGMALAGLLVGIPMFYTAGFVIVVPLIFATGMATRLPLLYVGIPMISALSTAHGFLPPHPSPTAISQQLGADIGKTLLYGLIISVPTIAIAGPLFGSRLKKMLVTPEQGLLNISFRPNEELPGLGISLFTALLPLILLTITTIADPFIAKGGMVQKIIAVIGDPNIAMLLSVLVAVWLLGLRRGQSMKGVMKSMETAFKDVAPIMLIIAGSGVFMQVIKDGNINTYIGEALRHLPVSPLVLGWIIAAVIRVCVGSATVAGLTTVGILLPLIQNQAAQPELMVLSIGAGSLMFSHVNDGGFWLFKEYFNLSLKQTFATWSVMETIVSVCGLAGVLVLQQFIG
ncbi:gluconate transporter [Chitinophaga alhagiae]|uniref:Gluconate transporter n=1 Tax=Chitinophaga alhagiae TaxID=2203219 RepID=A0ABN5LZ03_9BACT|nr:gluconate:H+ symporter [Chitinophaga alhagiae]AWO02141.1 gluconate transporter [Chitinophaga alhagiae]